MSNLSAEPKSTEPQCVHGRVATERCLACEAEAARGVSRGFTARTSNLRLNLLGWNELYAMIGKAYECLNSRTVDQAHLEEARGLLRDAERLRATMSQEWRADETGECNGYTVGGLMDRLDRINRLTFRSSEPYKLLSLIRDESGGFARPPEKVSSAPEHHREQSGDYPQRTRDCLACSVGSPGVYVKDGVMYCPHRPESPRTADPFANKYHELLLAVEKKFPGESRHATALRYIREREAAVSELKDAGSAQNGTEVRK